jgi:hypothetical protein
MAKESSLLKRHRPLRTCVVCRTKTGKNLLTRLLISNNHEINIDENQNTKGRGAYVCKELDCQQGKRLKEHLSSSLKADISPESWEICMKKIFEHQTQITGLNLHNKM